ncbi:MAG: hypothetical protein GF384_05000 [Elusimicrobia bacterium]|nr:hypothetical protein [Elusimicrobiota bacterium]
MLVFKLLIPSHAQLISQTQTLAPPIIADTIVFKENIDNQTNESRSNIKTTFTRLRNVVIASLAASTIGSLAYAYGGLDWYFAIKKSMPADTWFHVPSAFLDIITGIVSWGTSDALGQYLNQGRKIRVNQSLGMGTLGIAQGSLTHLLYNLADHLPLVPFPAGQIIFRTFVVGAGGFIVSFGIFAPGEALLRKYTGAEDYEAKKEWAKSGDVFIIKLIAAFKTLIVANFLPKPIRVPTEQVWDYVVTIISAYLMNRTEPVFVPYLQPLTRFIRLRKGSRSVLQSS